MASYISLELDNSDMRGRIGENNDNNDYLRAVQEFMDNPSSSELYRLSKNTILWIVDRINYRFHSSKVKYCTLNRVLIVLYYLAHSLSHTTLVDKFKIPRSSLNGILWDTMSIIYEELSEEIISLFVRPLSYFENQSHTFQARYGLENMFAAIDGTCIEVKAPDRDDWYSYINKNGIISMKSQVVVDYNYYILDICSGYPGGIHDAAVFEDSTLKEKMSTGNTFIANQFKILADSAYPDLPFIHKTGSGETINAESARAVVENAFAQLKSQWISISRRLDCDYTKYGLVFSTCCLLFNMGKMEQEEYSYFNRE